MGRPVGYEVTVFHSELYCTLEECFECFVSVLSVFDITRPCQSVSTITMFTCSVPEPGEGSATLVLLTPGAAAAAGPSLLSEYYSALPV